MNPSLPGPLDAPEGSAGSGPCDAVASCSGAPGSCRVGADSLDAEQLYCAPRLRVASRRMRDEIRLLGRSGGYTSDAKRAVDPREEPEAVDRETQRRTASTPRGRGRTWPRSMRASARPRASTGGSRAVRRRRSISASTYTSLYGSRVSRSRAAARTRTWSAGSRLWRRSCGRASVRRLASTSSRTRERRRPPVAPRTRAPGPGAVRAAGARADLGSDRADRRPDRRPPPRAQAARAHGVEFSRAWTAARTRIAARLPRGSYRGKRDEPKAATGATKLEWRKAYEGTGRRLYEVEALRTLAEPVEDYRPRLALPEG